MHNPFLSVTVLADEYDGPEPELSDFNVIRCWKPDSITSPFRLIKTIRECKPDVVWFNLVFSSFGGNNPVAAFLGLCIPLLTRLAGFSTHVTLHHLIETLDLKGAGIRHPRLYRLGGWFATRLLLMANSVTVLLPDYRRTLLQKYRGRNVHLRPHGVFTTKLDPPDFSSRGNPEHRILAFGKWGTYKKIESLIEAFESVVKRVPNARLVIAGENHPNCPGYIEALRHEYAHRSDIYFTGYVAEQDIPALFKSATLMVMPYTSAGGPSGVAHQAAQFGVPIISSDVRDFVEMAEQEGFAIEFYSKGDVQSLANCIVNLLNDQEKQREMSEQNFEAAVRLTMPQVINRYVRSFDWYSRVRSLQTARMARFPLWQTTMPAFRQAAIARQPSASIRTRTSPNQERAA